jgi:hypothetical protein
MSKINTFMCFNAAEKPLPIAGEFPCELGIYVFRNITAQPAQPDRA